MRIERKKKSIQDHIRYENIKNNETIKEYVERKNRINEQVKKFQKKKRSEETAEERAERFNMLWKKEREQIKMFGYAPKGIGRAAIDPEKEKTLNLKRSVARLNADRIKKLLSDAPDAKAKDYLISSSDLNNIDYKDEIYDEKLNEIDYMKKYPIYERIGNFILIIISKN